MVTIQPLDPGVAAPGPEPVNDAIGRLLQRHDMVHDVVARETWPRTASPADWDYPLVN